MDKKMFRECIQCEVYKGNKSLKIKIFNRYFNPATNSVFLFRKMQYLGSRGGVLNKIRSLLLIKKLANKYGITASPSATIGKGLRFVHPSSITIGARVVAGKNLTLYQNTTLGGARTGDVNKGNQPTIGDNVTIFANSLVLGKVEIGNNVIVGANSLLLTSVPSNCICIGSPAIIISKNTS